MSTKNPSSSGPALSGPDAAAYLGVTYRTLKEWRARRVGPAYVEASRRQKLYLQSDLDSWLAANRVERA